jgi:putative transcriptional regulator
MSEKTTIVRMRPDRTLERKTEAGWERLEIPPMRDHPPADEPAYDPDNLPLTEQDFKRMKRVPRTKTLRRALMLTQEEFAARYHIPIGTLRDWEQGRTEPDAPARAYLKVIAADPEGTAKKLRARRELRTSAKLTAPI